MTTRRAILSGLGALTLGSGIVVGSGAFTQRSVARRARITVRSGPSIALSPDPGFEGITKLPNGDGFEIDVEVSLGNRLTQEGIFEITNDGDIPYRVRIDYTTYGAFVTETSSSGSFNLTKEAVNDIIVFETSTGERLSPTGPDGNGPPLPQPSLTLNPTNSHSVTLIVDLLSGNSDYASQFKQAYSNREEEGSEVTFDLLSEVAVRAIDPNGSSASVSE
jgi:hypothetical protein